jgi:sugar phosphate isomerase/epimerase
VRLGVCAQALYHLPFERALAAARDLGFETIELPVDGGSPWIRLEEAVAGGWRAIGDAVRRAGLAISALSNHQEGQLLLGPHGIDTDRIHAGAPEEKSRFAAERLVLAAELAHKLDVGVVCGFTGCDDYSRWFPWPAADGYERMAPAVRDRLLPVLDGFQRRGVRFAHECHPKQFAYDLETARWTVELVDAHPAFGFNFDPANLLLAGIDPAVFIVELGERILHVHAKDGERVAHATRSGLLAHGAWNRPGRGFRFRVPGWGDLDWRRLLTELHVAGYRGPISVEHEDPTMGRLEGLRQAARHLAPLLLHDAIEEPWW